MKLSELTRHLRKHKCEIGREGGKHTIWKNPAKGTSAAVPRHPEVNNNTARRICDELGVPRATEL